MGAGRWVGVLFTKCSLAPLPAGLVQDITRQNLLGEHLGARTEALNGYTDWAVTSSKLRCLQRHLETRRQPLIKRAYSYAFLTETHIASSMHEVHKHKHKQLGQGCSNYLATHIR